MRNCALVSESRISISSDVSSASLPQLAHRLARHDDARHAGRALWHRLLNPRQAVAVGRRRAQHLGAVALGDVEVNTVKIVARLLGGDGEARPVDQPAQHVGGQGKAHRQLALGHGGEILHRQRQDGGGETPRPQRQRRIAAGVVELDLRVLRQLADDVEQRRRRAPCRGRRGPRSRPLLPRRWRSPCPWPSASACHPSHPAARWQGWEWCCGARTTDCTCASALSRMARSTVNFMASAPWSSCPGARAPNRDHPPGLQWYQQRRPWQRAAGGAQWRMRVSQNRDDPPPRKASSSARATRSR